MNRRHLTMADLAPPPSLPTPAHDALFIGTRAYHVQTVNERHDYKKRSGSSDGAQTYDTPVT